MVLASVCFDPCVGQDLPEFRVDDLDCEEPASDEFREQWLVDAEEFLRHHLESQQKGRKRPGGKVSKLDRVAGFHWMVTIEHQLRFFSNAGLGRYLLSDDDPCRTLSIAELAKRPDLLTNNPYLVVSSDQGGGGLQAWMWLTYEHAARGMLLSDLPDVRRPAQRWPCFFVAPPPFQ